MAEEIVNRVAQSKLKVIDLEELYPKGIRVVIDLKDWLFEGLVLKEKDFRETVANHDWAQYQNCFVAINCSTDAIIPDWAFMLVTVHLQPYAKKIVAGNLESLETLIFQDLISELDVSVYENLPVIVKGCSHKPIPLNAYVSLTQKLQTVAKSIMFGEACSSVPLFKRK
jgi:hypothetical protein